MNGTSLFKRVTARLAAIEKAISKAEKYFPERDCESDVAPIEGYMSALEERAFLRGQLSVLNVQGVTE